MQRTEKVVIGGIAAVVVAVGVLIASAPPRPHRVPTLRDTLVALLDTVKMDSVVVVKPEVPVVAAPRAPRRDQLEIYMVTSQNAAPVRNLDEIKRHLTQGAPGTYIGDILAQNDSSLVRWPESTEFRVWIDPSPTVPGWQPSYVDLVGAAFHTWEGAGAPIGVRFVSDTADANIRVHWTDRFDKGGAIGQTIQTWDQHQWLVAGDITLAMHSVEGDTLTADWIRACALHEVGHVFGLNHSSSSDDIMAAETHSLEISHADLATLRLLYALPPGPVR